MIKELTSESVCLALGYFDSVHLGHRALIAATREAAERHGCASAVATFSNNAYRQFNVDDKQVYTYDERCALLDGLCDFVLPMRFDARLKNRTAREFLDTVTAHHDIKTFVCGYDYLFGAGAKGDAEMLANYCKEKNIECIVMSKFELDGERVSTTEIKKFLLEGNVEKANEFLGEVFSLTGKVVRGRGAGRMFDIPTANIKFPSSKLLPKAGVYGTTCTVGGKSYYGATNVGARPTFGLAKPSVEMMISDFNDNIYGADIKVGFCKYLRPVKAFDTPAALSKQVHKDIRWYEHD